MDRKDEIRKEILEIEDNIRRAPQGTPNKIIFEWYTEIDRLQAELDDARRDDLPVVPDESNMLGIFNADAEDYATQLGRESFVDQWNEDSDKPQTWSQIVGTAKDPA